MGASASVERSPLSFRASLLVRYHASGSHRRTLAQAVYSGLYQAGEWSTWVSSEALFRVLWQCLNCENYAPTLDKAACLRALAGRCGRGIEPEVNGGAETVRVNGEDIIAFLASGKLPVRQTRCKQSCLDSNDGAPAGKPTAEATEETRTERETTSEESRSASRENSSSASAEQLLSSCLTLDHLVTLQEWILAPDHSGRSPLHYAKQANDVALLERMQRTLAAGGSSLASQAEQQQRQQEQPYFPLHTAAKTGKLETIKALLAAGLDPLARDERDNLPIYYACLCGHLECCVVLAEATGGVQALDAAERLRCSTNALNRPIRQFFESGVLPEASDSPDAATDGDADTTSDDQVADLTFLFG